MFPFWHNSNRICCVRQNSELCRTRPTHGAIEYNPFERSIPGMIQEHAQEIKYIEHDRKVTRAPLPPTRARPGEKVKEEILIMR